MSAYLVDPRATLEQWAPAFEWLDPKKVTTAEILRLETAGGRFCTLCEAIVSLSTLEKHANDHRVEFKTWRTQRRASARREAATRQNGAG